MDYGTQVKLGKGVFINAFSTWIDTSPIIVGARTLFGPYVSLYSGSHPLDPEVRNGIRGPECGKPIHIGEDCWIGGNVTILAGVTIGKGSTVGAASVVTKVCLSMGVQSEILTGCRMCRHFTLSRVILRVSFARSKRTWILSREWRRKTRRRQSGQWQPCHRGCDAVIGLNSC